MLERYGIVLSAIRQVREDLIELFGFSSHKGVLNWIDSEEKINILRTYSEFRGASQAEIVTAVEKYTVGKGIGAAYCADVDLGLETKPEYIIFMSPATEITFIPFVLGEEITHAEHVCSVIEEERITYREYQKRFHVVTEEFLGYIGRRKIHENALVPFEYKAVIGPTKNLSHHNTVAHWLAYYAVDGLNSEKVKLPFKELFHAQYEEQFWEIVLGALGRPYPLSFKSAEGHLSPSFAASIKDIMKQSKSEGAFQLIFK
jgi:hypothetical protein